MEKATFTPFSKRGRGSALRSQKTSWLPLASRFVSEDGRDGAVAALRGLDVGVGFEVDEEALGFAFEVFLGGRELHHGRKCQRSMYGEVQWQRHTLRPSHRHLHPRLERAYDASLSCDCAWVLLLQMAMRYPRHILDL